MYYYLTESFQSSSEPIKKWFNAVTHEEQPSGFAPSESDFIVSRYPNINKLIEQVVSLDVYQVIISNTTNKIAAQRLELLVFTFNTQPGSITRLYENLIQYWNQVISGLPAEYALTEQELTAISALAISCSVLVQFNPDGTMSQITA